MTQLAKMNSSVFPPSAPAANPVFFRTYSRQTPNGRESWDAVCDRTLQGLIKLGNLTEEEAQLINEQQRSLKALTSGRWLWIGGTPWMEMPENFSGGYNCTSTNVHDWRAFGLMMNLAMMGCGTGAVLEPYYIDQLPPIRNPLTVTIAAAVGSVPVEQRQPETIVTIDNHQVTIRVGDSRQGWVDSYQALLELSSDPRFSEPLTVAIDLGHVRPSGEALKGFGGVSNPIKLPGLYDRCAAILNKAIGRKLTSVECCLLIDEAAIVVVAGNVRRCLPENALVHTHGGLVPIKDVQVGDLVQTPIGFRRVVNKFDQGIQDVYEVETNATFARATLNHRMAVLTDAKGGITWKCLEALQEGDRLLHNTQILPGTVTQLPEDTTAQRPEQSRTAKPLTIPALTPDVAWLIGFTHGDGYVALGRNHYDKPFGRVEWAMNAGEPELAQRLEQKVNHALSLFGLTAASCSTKGENTLRLRCSSIRLAEYFYQHIKQPRQPLVIPSFILQGSIDVRSAYLAGLMDSDGAVNNRPPCLVTTVYRDFSRQVSAVLSSLGIAGRITLVRPKVEHWQVKYNLTLPAFKSQYNAIVAPHSVKGQLREGLKMYGFTLPGEMMRETYTYSEMQGMGFQGNRRVDSNYERYRAESEVSMDIPVTFKRLGSYDSVQTYDIEVEEAHCFYCEGYLTHNSAGIRQFAADDALGSAAKDNLWQQDEKGNWRIDPERDALRMANHTRVFHRKPTEQDLVDAVRKQFYSGEGAIQYAPEAIARANADLLPHAELKQEFLEIYTSLGREEAKGWIRQHHPEMPEDELEHRLQRYGLNPCVTADTWVHTEAGARQVQDLIDRQHGTYVNGELFSTTAAGFFFTGVKPVLCLETQEGYQLRLTANHQLLKVTAQTQKAQYTEWVEAGQLQPGDRILLHNHRGLQPWGGEGSWEEGWLLGNFVGEGCFAVNDRLSHRAGNLRYWGETQVGMREFALAVCQKSLPGFKSTDTYHRQNQYSQISSVCLFDLAHRYGLKQGEKTITAIVEQASYDFYRGFLRGLFDADGSVQGTPLKGVSVRLSQSNLPLLQATQRMLLRLGIVSKLYTDRRPEQARLLPNSQRVLAEYSCKAQHELVIANDNLSVFQAIIGFQDPNKAASLLEKLSSYQRNLNRERFTATIATLTPAELEPVYDCTVPGVHRFDANGLVAHNCGEIIMSNNHCNLAEVHLNQIDPSDRTAQEQAFKSGALSVAVLLNHQFQEPRYQQSRLLDPIVGVSFTGLFDFFVHAFGSEWLHWWQAGRPDTEQGKIYKSKEANYLNTWREIVEKTITDYCDRHGLKRPNRCTTVQPSGTKALLTGASPGWHPPKSQRFLRRITFRKNDPIALACLEYGYTIIPSQSDKDEDGNLLNDPFDPRCTEWLVEIPTAVSWADLPGADAVDISQFSALAQFDFYMQVQRHYTRHNTSATIELREPEVEPLAQAIYQSIVQGDGYMSAALLARFDDHQTFPRLPFEPISKEEYDRFQAEVLARRKTQNFFEALQRYDRGLVEEAGPAGCDSDKCLLPDLKS